MRHLPKKLKHAWSKEVVYVATCWKIMPQNGPVIGFTNHDHAISFDSVLYKTESGFNCSVVQSQLGSAIDDCVVEGVLDEEGISEEALKAGLYDGAEFEIFSLDWKKPEAGKVTLKYGILGNVTIKGSLFTAEIKGLQQKQERMIGELYSPTCRASLGDERCKVDLEVWTKTVTIQEVISPLHLRDNTIHEKAGFFAYGSLTCTEGKNRGLRAEIKNSTQNGDFFPLFPFPYPVKEGDVFKAVAGCNKKFESCKNQFRNVLNFRGEPHI